MSEDPKSPSIKDRSMDLPLDQAKIIMDAAIRAVMTPVGQRDFDTCIRLNEPDQSLDPMFP